MMKFSLLHWFQSWLQSTQSARVLEKCKTTFCSLSLILKMLRKTQKKNSILSISDTSLLHSKTDAEIHNMKLTARKNNVKNVMICNKELKSESSILCAYLSLSDTNMLQHLLFDFNMANSILKQWWDVWLMRFDILNKKVNMIWQKNQIWQYVADNKSLIMKQLAYDISFLADDTLKNEVRKYAF